MTRENSLVSAQWVADNLDTPGIVDPAYLLHHAMAHVVEEAIGDADVVVLVLDGTRPAPAFAEEVLETLRHLGPRLLVAVNKTDSAAARRWASEVLGREALALSAETGESVDTLRAHIVSLLPESPFLYPDDELSSQSVRFFVSELVRETVFERYSEAVP